MVEYTYITPREHPPEIARKIYRVTPIAQLIIEEFVKSGLQYAEINVSALSKYKNTRSAARGLGRIIHTLGQHEKVKVYSDSNHVYLERI